jgi:NHL repeat
MSNWTMTLAVVAAAAGVLDGVAPSAAGMPSPNACVVGTPSRGWCGDGGPATEARFASPSSLVADADGGFTVVDSLNDVIRHVTADGIVTTFARPCFRRENGRRFCGGAGGISRMASGDLLVASGRFGAVVRVSSAGDAHLVADSRPDLRGNGDGGPATKARLRWPSKAIETADGSILIADIDDGRIRRVLPNGVITTAWRGRSGIDHPNDLALLPGGEPIYTNGSLGPGTIQRIDAGGVSRPVAGRLSAEYFDPAGNGGPATAATLIQPVAPVVTTDGRILFADKGHNQIRQIAEDGTISAVAGDGKPGLSGDGGPATRARLSQPLGLAVTSDGSILIADSGNDRVRKVSAAGIITTVAGTGNVSAQDGSSAQLGECGGAGCGSPDYNADWNYFYIYGKPRASARRRFRVSFVTTKPARVTVSVMRRHELVVLGQTKARVGRRFIVVKGLPHGRYRLRLEGRAGNVARHDATTVVVR